MDIAELKKIITDQKNKLKALDSADAAIMQLESLGQAVEDYSRRIANLKKEEEKLKEINSEWAAKNKAEDEALQDKITKANQTAASIVDKATAKASDIVLKAHNDLSVTNDLLNKKQDAVFNLDQRKKELEADLVRLEDAIAQAKKKLSDFMG